MTKAFKQGFMDIMRKIAQEDPSKQSAGIGRVVDNAITRDTTTKPSGRQEEYVAPFKKSYFGRLLSNAATPTEMWKVFSGSPYREEVDRLFNYDDAFGPSTVDYYARVQDPSSSNWQDIYGSDYASDHASGVAGKYKARENGRESLTEDEKERLRSFSTSEIPQGYLDEIRARRAADIASVGLGLIPGTKPYEKAYNAAVQAGAENQKAWQDTGNVPKRTFEDYDWGSLGLDLTDEEKQYLIDNFNTMARTGGRGAAGVTA